MTITGRLARSARRGFREMPTNTAWLLAKAIRPVAPGGPVAEHLPGSLSEASSAVGSGVSDARRLVGEAGRTVADVVPGIGGDRVSSLMKDADDAAEHARQAEARAVRLAEQAKDETDAAQRAAAEADQEVDAARRRADDQVRARVEQTTRETDTKVAQLLARHEEEIRRARAEATRKIDRERLAEEAAARKTVDKVQERSMRAVREAEERAEDAQEQAAEAIRDADEALARARDLASQAAKAAQEAVAEATRDAERTAAEASARADEAKSRVVEAQRVRQRIDRAASQVASSPGGARLGPSLPADAEVLEPLTKHDLVVLADTYEIEGRRTMNKQELVDALVEAEVRIDDLTKRELLTVGEVQGIDVRTSMSKQELVDAISSSHD